MGVARQAPETAPIDDEPRTGTRYVDDIDFVPTTEFGRRLLELRRQGIAEGQPLLTRDELERELAERRGGAYGRDDR